MALIPALRGCWRISLPSMTFAVKEDVRGVVVEAAPIAAWTLGWRIERLIGYYRARGADIGALWYDE